MPYRNPFEDFDFIETLKNEDADHEHYLAFPLITPYPVNETFEESNVFIVSRQNEFLAQVEQACAQIFQKLMGYGPEVEILQDEDAFYTASRQIKNFTPGTPEENQNQVTGFASIFILSYFLGEGDMQSENYGVQQIGAQKRAIRIDLADALDPGVLAVPLTIEALNQIPYIVEDLFRGVTNQDLFDDYVRSQEFQNEKLAMIQLIANTPFAVFEEILQKTITVTNNFSPEELIQLLRARHAVWQQLAQTQVFQQDYTYADPDEYKKLIDFFDDRATKRMEKAFNVDGTYLSEEEYISDNEGYIGELTSENEVQRLEEVLLKGIKVTAHSVDVSEDESSEEEDFGPERIYSSDEDISDDEGYIAEATSKGKASESEHKAIGVKWTTNRNAFFSPGTKRTSDSVPAPDAKKHKSNNG